MSLPQSDALILKLQHCIGDSEASNWTEYSTQRVAKTVLCDFTAVQWQRLEQMLLQQAQYWQQRCAVCLGEDRSAAAIALLKRLLLESPYLDVRILAIYELDWCETPMDNRYRASIEQVIASLPPAEVEPELTRLLAKTEAGVP